MLGVVLYLTSILQLSKSLTHLRFMLILNMLVVLQGVSSDQLETKSLGCIVRTQTEGNGFITGVSFANNDVYVSRSGSSKIEVYSLSTFDINNSLDVDDLRNPLDLIASDKCNILYVADVPDLDKGESYLHKVELNDEESQTTTWMLEGILVGISIGNNGCDAIGTLLMPNQLFLFTKKGVTTHVVNFPEDTLLLHAVQLFDGQLVVALQEGPTWESKVCLVITDEGLETSTETCFVWPNDDESFLPTDLVVDKDGYIYVVDTFQGVIKLDSSMNLVKVVLSPDKLGSWTPKIISMNDDQSRFYLAVSNRSTGKGRILECQQS